MNDEHKYEVNLFFDKYGNVEKGHIKALCNHAEELENTLAAMKRAYPTTTAPVVAPRAPQEQVGATPNEMCPIHNVPLEDRVSKSTGKPYKGHIIGPGRVCFGK